jgi:hypothetical protein
VIGRQRERITGFIHDKEMVKRSREGLGFGFHLGSSLGPPEAILSGQLSRRQVLKRMNPMTMRLFPPTNLLSISRSSSLTLWRARSGPLAHSTRVESLESGIFSSWTSFSRLDICHLGVLTRVY